MSSTLGVFIMMNNYFHDVATALLLASGLVTWIITKSLGDNPEAAAIHYFLSIYKSVTRLALFSLVWIIIGGIPRTIFYEEFEWANAAGKNQIPALLIKHVLAFIFVGTGTYIWIKINKKVKKMRNMVH